MLDKAIRQQFHLAQDTIGKENSLSPDSTSTTTALPRALRELFLA
jgi:hypothetical protein